MACIAKEKGQLLQSATAARVGQADHKGWKDFTKSVQDSIKSLVLPRSETKKGRRSDQQMQGFFNSLAKAKGRNQVK
jgi:hypothetical protein